MPSTRAGFNLPPIGLAGAAGLTIGQRYRMDSGLGGTFDVRLLRLTEESGAQVRIDEPRNPDWHGWTFCVSPGELRPIRRLWQVRTRVGTLTGEPDDFLSWGRYASRPEAEAAAERASAYPSSLPVRIVEIEG